MSCGVRLLGLVDVGRVACMLGGSSSRDLVVAARCPCGRCSYYFH